MRELELESLAFGGDAVGRIDGKVAFVPLGAPGDRVRVRVVKEARSYCRAELVEVLSPGPMRRQPPCRYFGECGGCQWQQVRYLAQAEAKQEIFDRAMHGEAAAQEVLPLARAPHELAYRRRVRMHWELESGARLRLGYYRWRTRSLLDIERCPLLLPTLDAAIARCRAAMAHLRPAGPRAGGTLEALVGARAPEAHVAVGVEEGTLAGGDLEGLVEAVLGESIAGATASDDQHVQLHAGPRTVGLAEEGEAALAGSAEVFAQANLEQDRLLRGRVAEWARPRGARVLELYAGNGNLTRALSPAASEVVAVESSAAAAELLLQNAAAMTGTVSVRAQDAEAACAALAARNERFDVAVVDPPRDGLAASAGRLLADLGVSRIVYVSCDPMTLARDLVRLERHGYATLAAQAIDMMPQTYHIEAVALLERAA
jgi:23S rRNA (uracil1939-C5)-methyltransferase